jgi:hypothetical protein
VRSREAGKIAWKPEMCSYIGQASCAYLPAVQFTVSVTEHDLCYECYEVGWMSRPISV